MYKITRLNKIDANLHCADRGDMLIYPNDYMHLWRPFQEMTFEEAVRDHV